MSRSGAAATTASDRRREASGGARPDRGLAQTRLRQAALVDMSPVTSTAVNGRRIGQESGDPLSSGLFTRTTQPRQSRQAREPSGLGAWREDARSGGAWMPHHTRPAPAHRLRARRVAGEETVSDGTRFPDHNNKAVARAERGGPARHRIGFSEDLKRPSLDQPGGRPGPESRSAMACARTSCVSRALAAPNVSSPA